MLLCVSLGSVDELEDEDEDDDDEEEEDSESLPSLPLPAPLLFKLLSSFSLPVVIPVPPLVPLPSPTFCPEGPLSPAELGVTLTSRPSSCPQYAIRSVIRTKDSTTITNCVELQEQC